MPSSAGAWPNRLRSPVTSIVASMVANATVLRRSAVVTPQSGLRRCRFRGTERGRGPPGELPVIYSPGRTLTRRERGDNEWHGRTLADPAGWHAEYGADRRRCCSRSPRSGRRSARRCRSASRTAARGGTRRMLVFCMPSRCARSPCCRRCRCCSCGRPGAAVVVVLANVLVLAVFPAPTVAGALGAVFAAGRLGADGELRSAGRCGRSGGCAVPGRGAGAAVPCARARPA